MGFCRPDLPTLIITEDQRIVFWIRGKVLHCDDHRGNDLGREHSFCEFQLELVLARFGLADADGAFIQHIKHLLFGADGLLVAAEAVSLFVEQHVVRRDGDTARVGVKGNSKTRGHDVQTEMLMENLPKMKRTARTERAIHTMNCITDVGRSLIGQRQTNARKRTAAIAPATFASPIKEIAISIRRPSSTGCWPRSNGYRTECEHLEHPLPSQPQKYPPG